MKVVIVDDALVNKIPGQTCFLQKFPPGSIERSFSPADFAGVRTVPAVKRFFEPVVDQIFGDFIANSDGVEGDGQLGLALKLERIGVHTVGKFLALGSKRIFAGGFGDQTFLDESVDVESEVVVGDVDGFQIPKPGVWLE